MHLTEMSVSVPHSCTMTGPIWTNVSYWVSGGHCTVLPNTLTIVQESKGALTWLDDFASGVLDNNLSRIQVFDQELAATERLRQPDLVVYEQVVSISLEGLKERKPQVIWVVCHNAKAERP